MFPHWGFMYKYRSRVSQFILSIQVICYFSYAKGETPPDFFGALGQLLLLDFAVLLTKLKEESVL